MKAISSRTKNIIDLSLAGAGLVLFLVLYFAISLTLAVSAYVALAVILSGMWVRRFFSYARKYDEYFIFNQIMLAFFIVFFTIGTFTTTLTLTCTSLAGMGATALLFLCVKENGECGEEERLQKTWKRLTRRLSRLAKEEKKTILEESLRYQLSDNKLDGALELDKPICEQDGKAVSYAECDTPEGKATIGAYIDRVIDNEHDDKNMEV